MERYEVVAFDFDGTLVAADSFLLFARRQLGWWRLLRGSVVALPWIAAWKLGLISGSRAKERLFGAWYAGIEAREFDLMCDRFARGIPRLLRPEVVGELRAAVARGARVYIVSASIGRWIEPWAAIEGVRAVVATRAEVGADGRMTGRFDGSNCIGQEKVRRLSEIEPDRSAYRLTAWGDTAGDAALLAWADTARRL